MATASVYELLGRCSVKSAEGNWTDALLMGGLGAGAGGLGAYLGSAEDEDGGDSGAKRNALLGALAGGAAGGVGGYYANNWLPKLLNAPAKAPAKAPGTPYSPPSSEPMFRTPAPPVGEKPTAGGSSSLLSWLRAALSKPEVNWDLAKHNPASALSEYGSRNTLGPVKPDGTKRHIARAPLRGPLGPGGVAPEPTTSAASASGLSRAAAPETQPDVAADVAPTGLQRRPNSPGLAGSLVTL